ncbi:MAG: FkbM family methyltransferase [Anaerolineales bacterium]|nr:FkbM family methyltransferase [Anaerolineales bacterium]
MIFSSIDALKVDCEGFEAQVLRGSKTAITNSLRFVMLLEVHATLLEDVGSSFAELAHLVLGDLGLHAWKTGFRFALCLKSTDENSPPPRRDCC